MEIANNQLDTRLGQFTQEELQQNKTKKQESCWTL